jgi:ABC-type Mn2+/Zn2+ transport system ATPase subunit
VREIAGDGVTTRDCAGDGVSAQGGSGVRGMAGQGVVVRGLVRRTPQRRVVLDHLDLDLPAGAVTVVVGANGSGKSTFARVVAGVDRPDAGTVVRPVPRALLVAERVPALPRCSARTVARALAGALPGSPDGHALDTRLDHALDLLGSTHDAGAPLSRLSKGTLQKAYLAVAYALRPVVTVVDEPFTGLDPAAARATGELLRSLADAGGVVLATNHAPVACADQIHHLVRGRLHETTDAGPRPSGRWVLVDLLSARGVPEHLRIPAREVNRTLQAALAAGADVIRVVEDDAGTGTRGEEAGGC